MVQTAKKPKRKHRKKDSLEVPPDAPPEAPPLEEPEAEDSKRPPPRLVPSQAEQGDTHYEKPPDPDVFSISRDAYDALSAFVNAQDNRADWSLMLWKCNTDWPEDRRQHVYLPGRFSIPEGMLEEVVAQRHGPGAYYWKLSKGGHYASKEDLPPSLRATPLTGYVKIGGEEDEEVSVEVPQGFDHQALLIETLREQSNQAREDAKSGVHQWVALFNANTDAFKAQNEAVVNTMKAQNDFLQKQMEFQRNDAADRQKEKDGMWGTLLEFVQKASTGGAELSTTDRLLQTAPLLIDKLQGAGAFNTPSPSAPPPPSPAHPPASPPAPLPPPGALAPASQGEDPVLIYISSVVKKFFQCYQAELEPLITANALENLGTVKDYDWFMEQPKETVLSFIYNTWKTHQKTEVPPGLTAYAEEVWKAMHSGEVLPEPGSAGQPVKVEVKPSQGQEENNATQVPGTATPEEGQAQGEAQGGDAEEEKEVEGAAE